MKLFRIAIHYQPKGCKVNRWIKGFVLAKNQNEAWKNFKDKVREERCARCSKYDTYIEEIEANEVYVYKNEF